MAHYEQMANQFGDAKRAVNYLPKNMRSHLGQADTLNRVTSVANTVAAGAQQLSQPLAVVTEAVTAAKDAAAPTKSAVSVNIPYISIVLGVLAVVFLLKKK